MAVKQDRERVKTLTVRNVPPGVHRKLKVLAAQRGTTHAEVLRMAIERLAEENGKS